MSRILNSIYSRNIILYLYTDDKIIQLQICHLQVIAKNTVVLLHSQTSSKILSSTTVDLAHD